MLKHVQQNIDTKHTSNFYKNNSVRVLNKVANSRNYRLSKNFVTFAFLGTPENYQSKVEYLGPCQTSMMEFFCKNS